MHCACGILFKIECKKKEKEEKKKASQHQTS